MVIHVICRCKPVSTLVFILCQEHEVEVMFPLRPGRLPPSQVHNVIFITRPKPSLMDVIADNVLR